MANDDFRSRLAAQLPRLKALASRLDSRVTALREGASSLAAAAGRVEVQVEELRDEISRLEMACGLVAADAAVARKLRRTTPGLEKILRLEAERGVASLDLCPGSEDKWRVRIDGYPDFALPRRLGELLEVLAAQDNGAEPDGLVRWNTVQQISGALDIAPGKKHAVHNLVSRLRAAFRLHDVNPELIQRRKGRYRFALRATPRPTP